MRLLATARSYLPVHGGLQESTHQLLGRIADQGTGVAVLSGLLHPTRLDSWAARAALKLAGRGVLLGNAGLGYPAWRCVRPGPAIATACRKARADVVLAAGGGENTLAFTREVIVQSPVPVVLYVRDVASVPLAAERPGPAAVLTNAEHLSEMVRTTGVSATTVPSVIEPARYLVPTDRSEVLYVNPTPSRGLERAVALARATPDIPYLFQQVWPMSESDRADLDRRLAGLDNVRFRTPVDDAADLYGTARVLLTPYEVENRPRVIHEAGLNGIPTVATAAGGLVEATGPGGRLVVADASTDAWVEALRELWDDEAAYVEASEAARTHAGREEMDPDALARRVHAVLAEVIG